jgi:putative Mn2+ efflux pump MntP
MSDDPYSKRPVAGWYSAAAIASLLFMLAGCAMFVMHVTTDPATLPLDQRAVMAAWPTWSVVAFAIAVCAGTAGALLLVVKRRSAQPLLLVSLVATVVNFLPYVIVPDVRDNISTNDIAVAVGILVITWTIFWFARHSAQRGWLR